MTDLTSDKRNGDVSSEAQEGDSLETLGQGRDNQGVEVGQNGKNVDGPIEETSAGGEVVGSAQISADGQIPADGKAAVKAKDTADAQAPADKEAAVDGQATVAGRALDRSTLIKFIGMIAFLIIVFLIIVAMWPYISDVFTEGGVDRLVERVRNAGPAGVFILLGMQLLQIIVAFIPGEVVQLAAGLMYGPVAGAAIILLGCVISSALVYTLVHKLGAPFVRSMVSTEHLEKFRAFEKTGKLDIIVFVLFLIPAMPKDVFTYIVPLTDMKLGRFLMLTTIGRIPGVLASTYAAHGVAEGDFGKAAIVIGIVAVIAIVAILFREKIMDFFAGGRNR